MAAATNDFVMDAIRNTVSASGARCARESAAQQLDTLAPETSKRYMHHYNFPPYSTGETGRVGSPKRREIGHGRLAKRGVQAVKPSIEEFPYVIRVVSFQRKSTGAYLAGR